MDLLSKRADRASGVVSWRPRGGGSSGGVRAWLGDGSSGAVTSLQVVQVAS
ncbi:hypothetical protein PC129_g19533 [Phytophthora cactorum]|nr:hypothetical protein PC120_g20928 [Phytophthora cactorum]KAG3209444.1 hypothetical protein PC129_g19533 [Phytophthora cactorum]